MKKLIIPLLLALVLTGCAAAGPALPSGAITSRPEGQNHPTERVEIVEVGGQTVVVDDTLEQSGFTEADFTTDPATGRISCKVGKSRTGVDVSAHQEDIDWAAVAADGIDFAMLRIGVRGYSAGKVRGDAYFEENYAGAVENGLDVGCYFFSQAISVEEAVEEADFVLEQLGGRELTMPVVFDWEEITASPARTDDVDSATVTACAVAFCQRIAQAGYKPMVYCNGMVGYLRYELQPLEHLPMWYAEYESGWPSFAYDFDMWQYSCTGKVDGIRGSVDLNLYFIEE